ncbi:MAG: hypothetical protein K2K56_00895 [Lachnospiraceae bacterium]|nr:hypothetical protein [Lachnospiraceae bacterium]
MEIWDICGLWFILILGDLIREPFEHKLLWDNKKFKGYRIDAKVIYFDTVKIGKSPIDITVLNYYLYGKSKDTLLLKNERDKIGDIIEIISDGEVSYRVKRDWRDIFNGRMCAAMVCCCLSGLVFFSNLESINIYFFIGCIVFEIIDTLTLPISNRSFYRDLKKKAGWHVN